MKSVSLHFFTSLIIYTWYNFYMTSPTKKERVKELQEQVNKLQSKLTATNKIPPVLDSITVLVQKNEANFSEAYDTNRKDKLGLAKYNLLIDITAGKDTIYIPTSIASGRKSTGFIYQVEGSASGAGTASVTFRGEGTMIVTSGTISYCKIPAGKTASFRIQAEVTGTLGKAYKIVISRINYKLNSNDLRYKRFLTDITTETLKFR